VFPDINFEELYEYAPCGYVSLLPDGTIIKTNTTLINWLGFKREEIEHRKKFSDLISRSALIHYEIVFRQIINLSGSVKELSYDMQKKDGTLMPVLVSGSVLKDDGGRTIGISVVIGDNADRKKYERELLRAKKFADTERQRFEYIADLVPEIVWSADHNGMIDYHNKRLSEYFKLPLQKLTPYFVLSRIYKPDRQRFLTGWKQAVASHTDFQIDVRLIKEEGCHEWHVVQAVFFIAEEERLSKWFGSCHNIDQYKNDMERKDEFINIASHELKNPLTSLKAYIQTLQLFDLPKESMVLVERALSGVNNLNFLISSLLDTTIINSGELNLNLSNFSLTAVVKECVEQFGYTQKVYDIIFEHDEAREFMVLADKDRIIQVIVNLINNAIKYSPGSNKVIVSMKETDDGKSVTVFIRDFGMGIPQDKQKLIFEKFYRINEGPKNSAKGLGLGLYIIQNIMLKHESTIHVKSKANEGSVFYFSLPVIGN
jgi:PAS domain S-box-containing protein